MAAYFVVDIEDITDQQTYVEYSRQVQPTLDKYGGTFVVRGGAYETVEGDWQPRRFVILEFADVEQFKRWYNSPEYSSIRPLRFAASTARAIVVQGVETV